MVRFPQNSRKSKKTTSAQQCSCAEKGALQNFYARKNVFLKTILEFGYLVRLGSFTSKKISICQSKTLELSGVVTLKQVLKQKILPLLNFDLISHLGQKSPFCGFFDARAKSEMGISLEMKTTEVRLSPFQPKMLPRVSIFLIQEK